MALTTLQIAKIFQIMGIPQVGSGVISFSIVSLSGPTFESYDFSAVVTELNLKITALTADQETLVGDLITEWDVITPFNPLTVDQDGGSIGTLVNFPRERDKIRRLLGDLLQCEYGPPYLADALRHADGERELALATAGFRRTMRGGRSCVIHWRRSCPEATAGRRRW